MLCHISLSGNHGTGFKAPDITAVIGCSACHATIDARDKHAGEHADDILRAMCETHDRWRRRGFIT